jgi:3-methyladenine DNA glycosylase AlkC
LAERLRLGRRFAVDPHMGVRELAWISLRPHLAKELELGLRLLEPWVHDTDANARRFASEITRPRGVWCQHIQRLKDEPCLGEPILEPLNSDPSRYVQNSVANWINDASKSQPGWAKGVCRRWAKLSKTPQTTYIVKRALRTLSKGAGAKT